MLALLAQMLTAITDPANARKFWGAFLSILAFGLKQAFGIDLGPILDELAEVLILAANPVLVFWLENRKARTLPPGDER